MCESVHGRVGEGCLEPFTRVKHLNVSQFLVEAPKAMYKDVTILLISEISGRKSNYPKIIAIAAGEICGTSKIRWVGLRVPK